MRLSYLFYFVITLLAGLRTVSATDKSSSGAEGSLRILNGRPAKDGEFPHFIHVRHGRWCGGVLIGNGTVLTAGHCLNGKDYKNFQYELSGQVISYLRVRAKYYAEKSWIHEGYSFNGTDPPTHDVAVVKLKNFPAPKEKYAIAQLPTRKYAPGTPVTMVGYGKTESGDYARWLMTTDSKLIGENRCYPTFVCAESGRGGVCNGDSGGPLLVRGKSPGEDVVVGIASFAFEDCQKGRIGRDGFTDVYHYLDWIKDKLKR